MLGRGADNTSLQISKKKSHFIENSYVKSHSESESIVEKLKQNRF